MRNRASQLKWIFLYTAIVGALALQAGVAWAARDARLTAVKGQAANSTGILGSHAELAEGDRLETGDESGCSVLLDENAVVELCDQTRISLSTDQKRGNRIVNVESGSVRLIVEPREPGERIEIHTPAAIATILGTIIYVTVDAASGEATFTSSDSRVNIRDREDADCVPIGLPAEAGVPQCAEGTTIDSLEQLTVVPGEKQREKKRISEEDLALLGGCLLDFHDLAAEIDQMAQANKATQRVVNVDVAVITQEPVSEGGGEGGPPVLPPSDPPVVPPPNPIDGNEEILEIDVPPCNDGIPCEFNGGF